MTKQEEIREGVINNGLVALCAGQGFAIYQNIADRILAYLHSQGVVIKVERELPELPLNAFGTYTFQEVESKCNLTQNIMVNAGYVAVEPLIEEGK